MKHHSPGFLELVKDSKSRIKEISPQVLKDKIDHHEHMLIIDVRESEEWETGYIPTAIHLSKGVIERDIEKKFQILIRKLLYIAAAAFAVLWLRIVYKK